MPSGADSGALDGLARRARREVRGELALGGEVALRDAGPVPDPLVGGVDQAGQLVVAHDACRQIGADATDDRSQHGGQEAAACASGSAAMSAPPSSSMMRSFVRLRTRSAATSTAAAKPTASVPPWLFTTTPFRPRNMAPL